MKTKKRAFGVVFIALTTSLLLILSHYNLLEKYIQFALIPIFIAYLIGQYSERKFKD